MVEEIAHKSWIDFVNYILKAMPLDGYFRGQWNPEWGLVPGAFRRFSKADETGAVTPRDYAQEYLDLFKKYSSGMMSDTHHLPENDDDKLLIWAQNYGLITKLLDWSHSPFVASFFAFADCAENFYDKMFSTGTGEYQHKNVAVWYVPKDAIPSDVKIEKTLPLRMHRQASQGSVFMIPERGNNIDIATYPSNYLSTTPNGFVKHLVPSNQCFVAIESLYAMNIHYASLFPDLYGAAKQANFESLNQVSAEITRIVDKAQIRE